MKNQLFILLACIVFTRTVETLQAQTTTITYQDDASDFVNPERGFYHQWLSDSKSPSPLNSYHFNKLRQDKMTLIRRLYSMTTFRSGPISESYLQSIQTDMDSVRKNGVKVVLRFAYTFNESPPNNDAPLSIVLAHLDQLTPLLQKNYDVIAYMEAGFIGRWGEWHTSSNHLDNTSDRRTILLKVLTALPDSRSVAVRTQQQKKDIYNYQLPLTTEEGFNETDRARTGHHNDCFCASADDWGTYWPMDAASLNAQKNYLNAENRFLPQGGETCNPNPPRSDCEQAVADLVRMRWSALNADYEPTVLNSWVNQNCYSDVRKQLGYRFRLINATIPDAVSAGSELAFDFTVRNDGYASPYNQRDLEVVLRAKTGGKVSRFKLNDDPRTWLPEIGDTTVSVKIDLPSGFPVGQYDILLNLPDPAPLLNSRPEYAIRLANQNVWEAQTGYNSLQKSIVVTSFTGMNRENSPAFAPLIEVISIYPNPVISTTTVSYKLKENCEVIIALYDAMGRRVMQVADEKRSKGKQQTEMKTTHIRNGVYFMKISTGNTECVRRLIVCKN